MSDAKPFNDGELQYLRQNVHPQTDIGRWLATLGAEREKLVEVMAALRAVVETRDAYDWECKYSRPCARADHAYTAWLDAMTKARELVK